MPGRARPSLDVIGNKEYNALMLTYMALQADRRKFLAFTGLTLSEFQRLLTAFPRAYQRVYPSGQTGSGGAPSRSITMR